MDDVIKKIDSLARVMKKYGLHKLEYSCGDEAVSISSARHTNNPSKSSAKDVHVEQNDEEDDLDGVVVRSPCVGTTYHAPSPDAEPFVKVGDRVEKGSPLVIVEAMKVMNRISSPCAGVVTKILVENEKPVEYDQPIAIISEE